MPSVRDVAPEAFIAAYSSRQSRFSLPLLRLPLDADPGPTRTDLKRSGTTTLLDC